MPYCINCGQRLIEGAKYCACCGSAVGTVTYNNQRQQKWAGTIIKCPHCGETVSSFSAKCACCGNELREQNVSNSLNRLFYSMNSLSDEKEKIQLVKTFPIPNSKEDICEFMILATSNFNVNQYITHKGEDTLSAAWYTKINQCYEKATLTLQNTLELQRITKLYNDINNKIDYNVKGSFLITRLPYILVITGIILILIDIHFINTIGTISFIAGMILLFTRNDKSTTNNQLQQNKFTSWNQEKKVGWIILNILFIGIPAIIYSCMNKENKEHKEYDDYYKIQYNEIERKGFSSWNIGAKIAWIILNIYTIGIPAIIYACVRKSK